MSLRWGLAPLVVKDIFGIISRLSADGITILLIEQNANAALHAAHYGYVLETGMMTLSGTGEELLSSKSIQEAYLGRGKKGKTCLKKAPFRTAKTARKAHFLCGFRLWLSQHGVRARARQKPQVGRRYHRHDRAPPKGKRGPSGSARATANRTTAASSAVSATRSAPGGAAPACHPRGESRKNTRWDMAWAVSRSQGEAEQSHALRAAAPAPYPAAAPPPD